MRAGSGVAPYLGDLEPLSRKEKEHTMADPKEPKPQPLQPDEDGPKREAGDRPVPTPGHIGNLPDEEPGVGNPIVFPPHGPS